MAILSFRGIIWFLAIIVSLGGVLMGILSAGMYGAKTNDWQPLWSATGGLVAGADKNLEVNMNELINDADTLDARQFRFIQQDILISLGVLILLMYTIIRTAKWIMGEGQWNALWWFTFFIIGIILLLMISMFYVWSVTDEFHIPKGTWTFLKDGLFDGKFWLPGQGFGNALDIQPPNLNDTLINNTV
ncbi:MAG: hypothetical protein Q8P20_08760 [bacterium]|nr:hypothetical protein [bacterium]